MPRNHLLYTMHMFNNISIASCNKVHRANMGPTWVLSAPDGPHVCPKNLAIRDVINIAILYSTISRVHAIFTAIDWYRHRKYLAYVAFNYIRVQLIYNKAHTVPYHNFDQWFRWPMARLISMCYRLDVRERNQIVSLLEQLYKMSKVFNHPTKRVIKVRLPRDITL